MKYRNPLENEYLKLVDESRKKQRKLTEDQYKQIRKLYKDVANDLRIKARNANKGSLTQGWLKDYRKAILGDLKEVNKILEGKIQDNMQQSAENATAIQLDLFDKINMKYGLGMEKTFRSMFSNIPKEALNELITGDFYKDGRGLSRRIWFNGSKVNGDIDYIIQKGIAEKKSAYELAQDLQCYVNPEAKKDWDWKKVYPKTAKTIDYCAQRLARTSISHSYTLSMLKSCERNPFTTKVKWHSVFAPGRTCPLCKNRDGRVYLLKECPIDHPNGMCYQEPLLDDSLENIGSRLKNWVDGNSDSELDSWYKEYGEFFSDLSNTNVKKVISKNDSSDIIKSDNKEIGTPTSKNVISNIEWNDYIDVSVDNSKKLNEIHSDLNEFMHKNNKEKLVLLDLNNNIPYELEGAKQDEVELTKETKRILKTSRDNSIVFSHVHPSTTTFSRNDIYQIINYKSIKALTLECINGTKFIIERGNMKSSFLKSFYFPSKYDEIYRRVASQYPELEDESKISEIWNDFLNNVNKELAKVYELNYKEVFD